MDKVSEKSLEAALLEAALPFADLRDAMTAVVDQLATLGMGSWELADVSLDELTAPDRFTVPIMVPEGSRLVALCPVDTDGHVSTADAAAIVSAGRLVATLLAAGATADELRQRAVRAEDESLTDALTGLPNSRGWWQALAREGARCDRRQLTAVVAVVDLDNLKTINDREGHLAGDMALRTLADHLHAAVRATDIVARFGGDEFGVLAVDYDTPVPHRLVDRLRAAIADIGVSASIGAAVYLPGGHISDTFQQADADMYAAKRAAQTNHKAP